MIFRNRKGMHGMALFVMLAADMSGVIGMFWTG